MGRKEKAVTPDKPSIFLLLPKQFDVVLNHFQHVVKQVAKNVNSQLPITYKKKDFTFSRILNLRDFIMLPCWGSRDTDAQGATQNT